MSRFSDYLETISRINCLDQGLDQNQAVQWLFHCGMLFSTRDKWWGNFKFRHTAHEGIDITYFRTARDRLNCFDDTVKIPAMDDGQVLNICDDFLGKSLVVEQQAPGAREERIVFVYAHIIPAQEIKTGNIIQKNTFIATVCHTRKNPQLPPHLHFSCFEVGHRIKEKNLNWTLFSDPFKAKPFHPIFL
jgi:hypothetical protein